MPTYYEFFAGGGMARAGLGENWDCLFANDFCAKKASSYIKNFGSDHFLIQDVAKVSPSNVPGTADMAWASFPCQDMSLAGYGAGLNGKRSGTFWSFFELMKDLQAEGRGPSVIVLENVCGALTSHQGKDFNAICHALSTNGFNFGALVVDAVHFVPQSRPRLFIVAVKKNVKIPDTLVDYGPEEFWHTQKLCDAFDSLQKAASDNWVWWRLPKPRSQVTKLIDLIEDEPQGVKWHSEIETQKLISMMSKVNLDKLNKARKLNKLIVGTIYKRTRNKQQRAEVRFDGIAGCLRTPAGGSSRQILLFVNGDSVRSRLLSPREGSRLMGLSDNYELPSKYNDSYHLVGDGLVVPVVNFLSRNLLTPIITAQDVRNRNAA